MYYAVESLYDDVVLTTHSEEVHLIALEHLCKRFSEYGWKLNKQKSMWMVAEGKGRPRAELQFAGFHSRMIPDCSSLAAALNRLLRNVH